MNVTSWEFRRQLTPKLHDTLHKKIHLKSSYTCFAVVANPHNSTTTNLCGHSYMDFRRRNVVQFLDWGWMYTNPLGAPSFLDEWLIELAKVTVTSFSTNWEDFHVFQGLVGLCLCILQKAPSPCLLERIDNVILLFFTDHMQSLCKNHFLQQLYRKIDGAVLWSQNERNLDCIITFQTHSILQRFMLRFDMLQLDCNDHLYVYDGAHAVGTHKVSFILNLSFLHGGINEFVPHPFAVS